MKIFSFLILFVINYHGYTVILESGEKINVRKNITCTDFKLTKYPSMVLYKTNTGWNILVSNDIKIRRSNGK